MAILSKEIFYKNICSDTPCSILHLWSSNCIDGNRTIAVNVFFGCIKFFGPIYMLKLLLNWKKIDEKYLVSQVAAYMRSITYGVSFSILLFGSLCFLSRITELSYYHITRAGLIAGFSIFIESPENTAIDSLLFFNQAVECFINIYTDNTHKRRPRWAETLMFMGISSFVMYLFKTQFVSPKFTHLWFHPVQSLFDKQEGYSKLPQAPCTHKNPCSQHIYKATFKYFCVGYSLECIKNILPRVGLLVSKPKIIFEMLLNKKNVLFGLFFGGYAFSYRWISCYLSRKNGKDLPINSLIAGFIAGCTYYFRPNIQIIIIGFTTILQLLWQRLRKKYNLPNLPYDAFIYIIASGVLMHFRFLLEDYCPKYTTNMMNIATNNLAKDILAKFWSFLREPEVGMKQTIS